MRNVLSIAIAAFVASAIGAPLRAADEAFTVKGQLVDAVCFKKDGAAKALSPDHLTCAKDCLKKGSALGIFSEDMGLIRIVGDYPTKNMAKVSDLLGKQVEAKGTRVRGNDYTYQIEVTSLAAGK